MTVLTATPVIDLIAGFERHLHDLGRAGSTIDDYMGILRRMNKELPAGLAAACEEELREWIYIPGRARSTRKHYRTAASLFFAWCTDPDDPHLDYDSARKLPIVSVPRGRPRPVPAGQHADILARAQKPYRDWFIIASCAGARCIEIAALDREHITEHSTWLQGKGDKDRYVPTHPLVWALAQDLPAGPVARDYDGSRLSRQKVSHRGNHQLRSVLGYPGVSMHRFRHTFGTEAYEACKDIRAVQELMGHGSISTTEIYVAVSEATMRRAVLGLPVAA